MNRNQKYAFSGESLKRVSDYIEQSDLFCSAYRISKATGVNFIAIKPIIQFLKEKNLVVTELTQDNVLLVRKLEEKEKNDNDCNERD
ncbi:hypothetical protein HOM13_04510 [Candidatus Woesearchaeota archaeon]|jgi:hypothetical protein|nr:hypothetical protein [Candidatus Woesearchaeota archaeon]